MARRTFSIGGVHPNDAKISRDCKIETLPTPPVVYIAVAQHIGAPPKPVVAVGDKVKAGQVIAEPGGFMSAYIHSSVSGTVKSIGPRNSVKVDQLIDEAQTKVYNAIQNNLKKDVQEVGSIINDALLQGGCLPWRS